MWTQLFNAVVKFFCGPPDEPSKPQEHTPYQQVQQQQPQQQYPQQHQQQYPSQQQQPPHRPPHAAQEHKPQGQRPPRRTNDNEINSANEYYKGLRSRANDEGDQMSRAFTLSKEAYNQGDHTRAKQLSTEGKEHQRRMEQFNREASDWIYKENNLDSQPDEIDLHGLYVKEAITRTEQAVESAKRRGDTEVKLIVGKGLHSSSGAKIRPAIEELMKKHQLDAEVDPNNAGVLIVRFDNTGRPQMGPDEISRRIERNEESCAIM